MKFKPLVAMEDYALLNLNKTISEIRQGFSEGLIPKLADDGTSGTYFLHNLQRKNIVIRIFIKFILKKYR